MDVMATCNVDPGWDPGIGKEIKTKINNNKITE